MKKNSTDNYNPYMGKGSNSTDNAKDGPIDKAMKSRKNSFKDAMKEVKKRILQSGKKKYIEA